jgi:hypothetical protein
MLLASDRSKLTVNAKTGSGAAAETKRPPEGDLCILEALWIKLRVAAA